MTKAGEPYQELVAAVAAALDPEAIVKVGQWIEGPDGEREVDVEVRGTKDRKPHFALLECKDWKRPVDVQEVDKLDSKRQDLAADETLIYSNSGFTAKALRKATRVGIAAMSALAIEDKRVRVQLERAFYARRLSVERWSVVLFPAAQSEATFPATWDGRTLELEGRPLTNWFRDLSTALLRLYKEADTIEVTFLFKTPTTFMLDGAPVTLRGIRLLLSTSSQWLAQRVRDNVSLGLFDHIKRRIVVPNGQEWEIGWLDTEAWEEVEEPEELKKELEEGTFRLDLFLCNPVAGREGGQVPDLSGIVAAYDVRAEKNGLNVDSSGPVELLPGAIAT